MCVLYLVCGNTMCVLYLVSGNTMCVLYFVCGNTICVLYLVCGNTMCVLYLVCGTAVPVYLSYYCGRKVRLYPNWRLHLRLRLLLSVLLWTYLPQRMVTRTVALTLTSNLFFRDLGVKRQIHPNQIVSLVLCPPYLIMIFMHDGFKFCKPSYR